MRPRISYADVFGVRRPRAPAGQTFCVGDVVQTGRNRWPRYRVLAIDNGKAWVRGEGRGRDYIVPLARLRKAARG